MNPFLILDDMLKDYAPPRVRRLVHLGILLIVAILTVVLAADGDWLKALLPLATAVYASANFANTDPATLSPAEHMPEDDGVSYADAGGQEFPEDVDLDAQGNSIDYDAAIKVRPDDTPRPVSGNQGQQS